MRAIASRRARSRALQAILGTPTATATIEEALDLIIFRSELMEGTKRAFGLPIRDAFPDDTAGK